MKFKILFIAIIALLASCQQSETVEPKKYLYGHYKALSENAHIQEVLFLDGVMEFLVKDAAEPIECFFSYSDGLIIVWEKDNVYKDWAIVEKWDGDYLTLNFVDVGGRVEYILKD